MLHIIDILIAPPMCQLYVFIVLPNLSNFSFCKYIIYYNIPPVVVYIYYNTTIIIIIIIIIVVLLFIIFYLYTLYIPVLLLLIIRSHITHLRHSSLHSSHTGTYTHTITETPQLTNSVVKRWNLCIFLYL